MELTVNITTNCNGCSDRLQIEWKKNLKWVRIHCNIRILAKEHQWMNIFIKHSPERLTPQPISHVPCRRVAWPHSLLVECNPLALWSIHLVNLPQDQTYRHCFETKVNDWTEATNLLNLIIWTRNIDESLTVNISLICC